MYPSILKVLNKMRSAAQISVPTPATRARNALQTIPRCAHSCNFGYCRLMAEPWFTRVLSLERKRSERSGKPFLLVLLDMQAARELNGDRDRMVHQLLTGMSGVMRETDVIGWYSKDEILGVIFTELGKAVDVPAAVSSITQRVSMAVNVRVDTDKESLIKISLHLFPENYHAKKPQAEVDESLYPAERDGSHWIHSVGKRTIDILGSALALVLLSPLFLVIAGLIKATSQGPVFFRQRRIGQFGKPFTFFKFRSMHVINDSAIHEKYVKELISGGNGTGNKGIFKIQNDPRVTPIGRFLRKSSLDELPQFWNVLRGDMSLVGPRPPIPYEVDAYDLWHRRRVIIAKPGITGLWQVKGRSRTTFDDMVRLDLRYAEHCSLWLDLKILLQTPMAVVAAKGAY